MSEKECKGLQQNIVGALFLIHYFDYAGNNNCKSSILSAIKSLFLVSSEIQYNGSQF
jgi:hypothetical protein